MGYIKHHAIAVSSWDGEKLAKIHQQALEIFGKLVTPILPGVINFYQSFFIGPEGWDYSELGDKKRECFAKLVEKYAYEDGGNSIRFCEFFYSDDNKKAGIVRHN